VKRVVLLALLAACGGAEARPQGPRPTTIREQVVWDFERATRAGAAEWATQFDYEAVGAYEILLRRYDLLGRLPELSDAKKAELAKDDGTPFPPERERRNVGKFYDFLARPTVGDGGCAPAPLHWHYNELLGVPFEPLPPGNEAYEPLRLRVNGWIEKGGVVGIRCAGGNGRGLALVWTARDNARGYDIITIYDDGFLTD
jgi:hypothetical protein